MNISDIGLIAGFIASLALTVMPKIEDYDALVGSDTSLQRKRKNFRARIFYRSMLAAFSLGFFMQYIESVTTKSKTAEGIMLEFAVCVGGIILLMSVMYALGVFANRQVRMRVRYVPQYPNKTQTSEDPQHAWMFIIENRSYSMVYHNAVLYFPDKVRVRKIAGLAVDEHDDAKTVSISALEPRCKIHVLIEGLSASDIQGSGGDSYLSIDGFRRPIWPETTGALSITDY